MITYNLGDIVLYVRQKIERGLRYTKEIEDYFLIHNIT